MDEAEFSASLATAAVLRRRADSADLRLPVSGRSMGRRYRPGSLVEVTKFARLPRIGEVWAYVDPGGALVVHRCVWHHRSGAFRFKGDSERSADPLVPVGLLVGQVVFVHDGARVWVPRRWHAVAPAVRVLAGLLTRRSRRWLGRVRRYVKTVSGSEQ